MDMVKDIAHELYSYGGFNPLEAVIEAEKIEKEVYDESTGIIDTEALEKKMRWYRGE